MKAYLRQYKQFSINFTELAIIQGLRTIMPAILQNIFRHCGHQIEIWIATCLEQTANQNTNIVWQYCKVARKWGLLIDS